MRKLCIILLYAGWLTPAHAEFQLFVVDEAGARPAPPQYSLGTVYPGDAVPVHFQLHNLGAASAVLSYLEVRGTGFGPKNPLALPMTLESQAKVDFTVTFSAAEFGLYAAIVDSEGTSVVLTATVPAAPPLPAPRPSVALPSYESGQQGVLTVALDAPAPRTAMGSVTLDFQPGPAGAADPAIVFSTGARTTEFLCDAGATQCRFADQPGALFQTGTTSGVLTFTARFGTVSVQSSVTISPAPVSVMSAQGFRVTNGVEVRITGFDNARTAGPVAFTFFDAAGNPVAPGMIQLDAAAAFRRLYQTSDAGGAFVLRAVFPVTGDTSDIRAFEANLSNSAGAAACARTKF